MLSVQVRRCSILQEFTGEQQQRFFGISRDKTVHHIDTLYYAVFLNEPDEIVRLQKEDRLPSNLTQFLQMLRNRKNERFYSSASETDAEEPEMTAKSFSIYEYCVSKQECFDIFISSYLPNHETPRIVVQLRSRYLVLKGVKEAIEESFASLRKFLSPFGLFPVKVRENRIDFAYHTNLIQNPYKFFNDDCMRRHLKSNLRKFAKYGTVRDNGIELETLSLGNRKSNNVYWRGYNKCQEVIRKNYKSFFFQRWYDCGLISAFDKYVYEVAYEMRSYRMGCLVGRLRWYLEFGSDETLKREFQTLLQTNYIQSNNVTQLEKKLHHVIPEPTLVMNIEYQTKRKFYTTCSEWLSLSESCAPSADDPLLQELFSLLGHADSILRYLTGFGNTVSFVRDRNMTLKEFLEAGEPYMAWWKRIRSTPIAYASAETMQLYRRYDVRASTEKARYMVQGQVARLAMLVNRSTEDRSFVEDMADVLCVLNDNDMRADSFIFNSEALLDENGALRSDLKCLDPRRYAENRQRKARQLRGILRREDTLPDERSKELNENFDRRMKEWQST